MAVNDRKMMINKAKLTSLIVLLMKFLPWIR